MHFPGRNVLFVVVVGLLVVPLQTTLDPGPAGCSPGCGIAGRRSSAVWLAHTGYGLPFAIYLLRNFMGGLPREVFESAAIDGASPATAFFRLALPMSVPAIAALAIFQFLFVWNDLLVALIYIGATNSENLPLTVDPRQPRQLARRRTGSYLDGGGLHLDGAAARRLLRPAALLRPRHHRRRRQGLTGRRAGVPPPARRTSHIRGGVPRQPRRSSSLSLPSRLRRRAGPPPLLRPEAPDRRAGVSWRPGPRLRPVGSGSR